MVSYIFSIHKGFCFRQGILSPISDLTERLLLEERDPPAIPQESLYEAQPFDEVQFSYLGRFYLFLEDKMTCIFQWVDA